MDEHKERRATPHLTADQIDEIAERAAEKAIERVYTQIGKSVVSKFLWLAGTAALALYAYLNGGFQK